jgi:hypothetical protein
MMGPTTPRHEAPIKSLRVAYYSLALALVLAYHPLLDHTHQASTSNKHQTRLALVYQSQSFLDLPKQSTTPDLDGSIYCILENLENLFTISRLFSHFKNIYVFFTKLYGLGSILSLFSLEDINAIRIRFGALLRIRFRVSILVPTQISIPVRMVVSSLLSISVAYSQLEPQGSARRPCFVYA